MPKLRQHRYNDPSTAKSPQTNCDCAHQEQVPANRAASPLHSRVLRANGNRGTLRGSSPSRWCPARPIVTFAPLGEGAAKSVEDAASNRCPRSFSRTNCSYSRCPTAGTSYTDGSVRVPAPARFQSSDDCACRVPPAQPTAHNALPARRASRSPSVKPLTRSRRATAPQVATRQRHTHRRRIHFRIRQQQQPLDYVPQYAHVARPAVSLEFLVGCAGDRNRTPIVLLRDRRREMIRQRPYILAPVAQRRQSDGKDINAMVQILAENSAAYEFFEIAMGLHHHAHIHFNRSIDADAYDLLLHEHPQQRRLHQRSHIADFVQE